MKITIEFKKPDFKGYLKTITSKIKSAPRRFYYFNESVIDRTNWKLVRQILFLGFLFLILGGIIIEI